MSNIFYFHPYLGKIPILTNIFQIGWNHQLVYISYIYMQKCLNVQHDHLQGQEYPSYAGLFQVKSFASWNLYMVVLDIFSTIHTYHALV